MRFYFYCCCYSALVGVRSIVMMYSVCESVCLSVCTRISGTTGPNFTKMSACARYQWPWLVRTLAAL